MLSTHVNRAVRDYHLISSGDIVLIMLSGGGDSVALTHLLHAMQDELGLAGLYALHVNHGLRGEASEGDEAFVRELCGRLEIPLTVARYDVAGYAAEEGLNLEEAGRILRYRRAEELLDELGQERDINTNYKGKIATAHNLNDRVETYFTRIISGAGMGALASIPPKRGRIIRPLIRATREELRAYLRGLNEAWREDETNEDDTRNRVFIRKHIVPKAEELNPHFLEGMTRTLDLLASEDELLGNMADMFARDFVDDIKPGAHISFNLPLMRTLEPAMRRRTLRSGLMRAFDEAKRLDSFHIAKLLEGLDGENFVHELPESLRAETRYDRLKITKMGAREGWEDTDLSDSGDFDLGPAGSLSLTLIEGNSFEPKFNEAHIDADALLATLSAGPLRVGERVVPLGMTGSKLLSDIFIDAKYPREERAFVPIVRDGQEVVWVAGHVLSDRYKVQEDTSRIIRMVWTPGE